MDNLAYRYNRLLLLVVSLAPLFGFLFLKILDADLFTSLQLFSYLGVALILIFKKKTDKIIFPRYLLFYILFTLYVYYSAFFQLDREFRMRYLFSNRLIGAINFLFIIENVPISKQHFKLLIKICFYIFFISIFAIVIQEIADPTFLVYENFRRLDLINSTDGHQNRLLSIYSWIGELSEVGFSFVPVFILLTEYVQKQNKNIFIYVILGFIYAILSKARWVMVNSLMVFGLLFLNKKDKLRQIIKYSIVIPILSLVLYFGFNAIGFDVEGIVNKRILENDKKYLYQKSASSRLLAFEAFNRLYWKNALFGKGSIKYGMGGTGQQDYELKKFLRRRSSQIHVGYLSLFYMYGLIGGSLFMIFLILFLSRLYKQAKLTGYWAPFLGLLGFALANFTLVHFALYQMGFIIVLMANKYYLRDYQSKLT